MASLVIEWFAQEAESREILNLLASSQVTIISSQVITYSRGIYKYVYVVITNSEIEEKINSLINEFKDYQPLTITFDTSSVDIEKVGYLRRGLRRILEADMKNYYHLEISDINITEEKNIITAKPIDNNGLLIYISPQEAILFSQVDFQSLVGYDLLPPILLFGIIFEQITRQTELVEVEIGK